MKNDTQSSRPEIHQFPVTCKKGQSFLDLGLNVEFFNVFCLSRHWADFLLEPTKSSPANIRLRVILTDPESNTVELGLFQPLWLKVMPLDQALENHAALNHYVMRLGTPSVMRRELKKYIEENYERVLTNHETTTVIYMLRKFGEL